MSKKAQSTVSLLQSSGLWVWRGGVVQVSEYITCINISSLVGLRSAEEMTIFTSLCLVSLHLHSTLCIVAPQYLHISLVCRSGTMHTTRKLDHLASEHQWVWLREAEDGERRVACSCGLACWHSLPWHQLHATAQLQHGAVGRKWNVAAPLLGSPAPGPAQPRQPPTRLLLFYARLGPAPAQHHSQAADSFPSPCWSWCWARGRIATPMCYITIISAPSPATEP